MCDNCFWNILRAAVLACSRLQKDGGGASICVGGAPLYAPPLHPQLFPDLLDLSLQQTFLSLQTLFLRLSEAAVASSVEPEQQRMRQKALNFYNLHSTSC